MMTNEKALKIAEESLEKFEFIPEAYDNEYTKLCAKALAKRTPRKPCDMAACRDCDCIVISGDCPTCSAPGDDSYKFCPRCGQALKWPVLKWPEDFGKWEVEMVNFADEDFVKI